MFDLEALNKFYSDLSASDGMKVTDFQNRLMTLFAEDSSIDDLNNYRLGRPPWKKLRDEITPVSRFLQFNDIQAERVRFPLDNNTPDCWLVKENGEEHGIEVTIERGTELFHLTTEMIETGTGRGFIGMQDDASPASFYDRMSHPRIMYSTDQALEETKNGIIHCLSNKNHQRYQGVFYLLIHAHLSTLSRERWCAITEELSEAAALLPFEEVHVIGNADQEPWGFQIK